MRWKCGSPILKNASICQDAFMAEYGQMLSHGESHGAGANSQNLGLHGSFSGAGTHWAIQAIHVSKHHACWERLQYVRAAWTSVSIKGGDVAHEQGD